MKAGMSAMTVAREGRSPASASSAADVSQREEEYVATEAVRVFLDALPGGLGAGLLGVVVIGWMLQRVGVQQGVVAWMAAQSALLGLAFAGYLGYRRVSHDAARVRAWGRRFVWLASASAGGWGSAAFYFLPGSPTVELVTILSVSVIVIGGIGHMAAYLPVYFGFLLSALLPLAIALARIGDQAHLALSVGVLGMMFGLPVFALQTHRSINNSLALAFRNRELADALEQRRRDAEQANLAKSRFLAAASHDLRQPVHALGLLLDVLRGQGLNAAQDETVEQLRRSTDALEGLFNGLLDISKLDAGVVAPRWQDVALEPWLRELAHEFDAEAAAKGIRLRVRALACVVRSDGLLLGRILRNLLSNAVRYTNRGGVLLACRRHAAGITIEVWDTGIGIPVAEHDAVFDEFYQCGNPERDRSLGLGLGLAIVRRLAQLLGHDLEMRSVAARGTLFRLSLACGAPATTPSSSPLPAQVDTERLPGRVVLVVDDDAMVREATVKLLRGWGCEAIACANMAALTMVAGDWPRAPDLIVSDLRLPGASDGLAVVAWLRDEFNCDIPAVIMTGDVIAPTDMRAAYRTSVLHKPVSPTALKAALLAALDVGRDGDDEPSC